MWFLYFDGAGVNPQNPSLPCYSELIPLASDDQSVDVKLQNTAFMPVSAEELRSAGDWSSIGDSIKATVNMAWERKKPVALLSFLPFRKNASGTFEKLVSFDLQLVNIPSPAQKTFVPKRTYAAHSVLATGSWYKIGISNTGIYRLTYSDLQAMGLDPSGIDPRNLRLYGNAGSMLPEENIKPRPDDLLENSIFISGESDGKFDQGDYILFFGQSPHTWKKNKGSASFSHTTDIYSDRNYYFLTVGSAPGRRVAAEIPPSGPANKYVNTFTDHQCHEIDQYNLIHSGKAWYGEKFDVVLSYDLPAFEFPGLVTDSTTLIRVSAAARSLANSQFMVWANNSPVLTLPVPPVPNSATTDYANDVEASASFNCQSNTLNLTLKYFPQTTGSLGWLNFVEVNALRQLRYSGSQLNFRDTYAAGHGNIAEYTISDAPSGLAVWDVTYPLDPKIVTGTSAGTSWIFKSTADSLKEFVAFDGSGFLSPDTKVPIASQDLHALQPVDLIIITYPDFMPEAQRLAGLHFDQDGMSSCIVTPEQVYNEFSSGKQDVTALRDFVRMLYTRALPGGEPGYLLMFGKGSYDYKNHMGTGTNLVPSYESENSLKPTESYVTDDFFTYMDDTEGNGSLDIPDLGAGRFPVQTIEQATDLVNKVERYLTQVHLAPGAGTTDNISGDWRNVICFVADDEDGNIHLLNAEQLSGFVDTAHVVYNIDKFYCDAYQEVKSPGGQRYPEVNDAINHRVQNGALIINYTGHGGEVGWAQERILEISDINAWTNVYNMPAFLTATCEFSRFDDPALTSAGELVILNPGGGGIALFTTTRLSFSSANFGLNMNFYANAFNKIGDRFPRMGDLIRLAKTPSNLYIKNVVLLGDPALQLAYPLNNVATTSINGTVLPSGPDTLRALSKVTVTGSITDGSGVKLTGFNGMIYPTVYDKPSLNMTRGNDPDSYPTTFYCRNNVIYKGKISVVNGDFSFSFVVPRDISFYYGKGKISYFATSGTENASGYFDDFIIGGIDTGAVADNRGPDIRLFLNDTNFRFGGITSENPVLLALLSDSNGINTTGIGIGHDMVAILDTVTDSPYLLNDYYQSDLDSYQRGMVSYPLYDLADGIHTLRMKAWDVCNNSSEAYTEFMVAHSIEVAVDKVMNYPNPFIGQTAFIFDHNQPGKDLGIKIEIFDLSGRILKTITRNIYNTGFRSEPIWWDGTGANGSRLGKGIYVYRLTVTNPGGSRRVKTEKLVLLK